MVRRLTYHCRMMEMPLLCSMALLWSMVDSQFATMANQHVVSSVVARVPPTNNTVEDNLSSFSGLRPFYPLVHKRMYEVAVQAPMGIDAAFQMYSLTFADYLTQTAGKRFVPPIEFRITPVYDLAALSDQITRNRADFIVADPMIVFCTSLEDEWMQPLATMISHWQARGREYDLDITSGIIFTLAKTSTINSVEDLKDKVVAATHFSPSYIMGGPIQFQAMHKASLSHVMDVKQMVFTVNSWDVTQMVLNGVVDAGFMRTGLLERMTDVNGEYLDLNLFKVIEPKIYVMQDGNLFPFLHSVDLYPEWSVVALSHVDGDVAREVQDALMAMSQHSNLGKMIEECRSAGSMPCEEDFPFALDPNARCDSTIELATLAREASVAASIAGFRTPLAAPLEQFLQMESIGLLTRDDTGKGGQLRCTSQTLNFYDSIVCPSGYYKLRDDEFYMSCDEIGLKCPDMYYDCWCKPCRKGFEVDIYPYDQSIACPRMSLCGSVEQTHTISFRAYDNRKREDPDVQVVMHFGDTQEALIVERGGNSWTYAFNWTSHTVGIGFMEITFNDEPIPESPLRVEVVERDCNADYPGQDLIVGQDGACIDRFGINQTDGDMEVHDDDDNESSDNTTEVVEQHSDPVPHDNVETLNPSGILPRKLGSFYWAISLVMCVLEGSK